MCNVLVFSVFGDNQMFLSHLQRLQGGIKKSSFLLTFSTEGHDRRQWQHLRVPSGRGSFICSSFDMKPLREMVRQHSVTVGRQHMHLLVVTFILRVNHTVLRLSQYLAGNWKPKDINMSKMEPTVLRTEKRYGEPVLSGSSITMILKPLWL